MVFFMLNIVYNIIKRKGKSIIEKGMVWQPHVFAVKLLSREVQICKNLVT